MADPTGPTAPAPDESDPVESRWQALRQRLEGASTHLARQGSLASRKAGNIRVWSVRYYEPKDGRKVQRSIYVGTDRELRLRTYRWLYVLKAETRWMRQLPALCRATRGLVRGLARRRKIPRPGRPS